MDKRAAIGILCRRMTAPLLTLENVACQRSGLTILAGVSLALSPGDAAILRGPNGVGKTTLLRTIAGLQPEADGRVECDPDETVYAGHADGVKATLTVAENLDFWAGVYGSDGIDVALAAFDLVTLRSRPAGMLSAGQRRRLGLSRCLVSGRRLWLLDEPTVSLDTASVALFAKAVTNHLGSGGGVLIATHIDLGLSAARDLDLSPFRVLGGKADKAEDVFL